MADIREIIETLESQRTVLADQKQTQQRELAMTEANLARVVEAITALHGANRQGSRKGKPSPKKDQVRNAVRTALMDATITNRAALVADVGKRITAAGCSRSGLALRLAEVLAEPEFHHIVTDGEGESLESQT